jgi:type IV secretion system protein VirB11
MMTNNTQALFEYLKPLQPFLSDPAISEISINEPRRLFAEKSGEMIEYQLDDLSYYHLRGLADLIARFYGHVLNEQSPLLSATLPSGHRIQVVIPPACEQHKIVMSLRKTVTSQLTLDDFVNCGAFDTVKICYLKQYPKTSMLEEDANLVELFQKSNYVAFLKQAILFKKNIIISGGTSSGKTTLLNACLQEVPSNERIITLEDVREIKIPHQNAVHLLSSHVSLQKLIEVSLRLRPDRIIIGEIRGQEVIDFCHANQTGHSGSLASIHADHPAQVFDRVVQLMRRYSSNTLTREDILIDWINLIDVIVQMKRENGKRIISQIYFSYASPE